MEDLYIKIYMKKEMKYCAGCLHTEDVTNLSKMHNYSWIFTALFTNLYLTEELHDSWICPWCVRRINNAKKLLENFQTAQNIISKINFILNSSKSHEIDKELRSEITKLKKTSRLYFNALLDDSKSYNSDSITELSDEKYELDVKCEDMSDYSDDYCDKLDEEYKINSVIDFASDNSFEYRVLRSRKGKNVCKKEKNSAKKLKRNGTEEKVDRKMIRKANRRSKTESNNLKIEKDFNTSSDKVNITVVDNAIDDVLKVVKIEFDHQDSESIVTKAIHEIPSIDIKSKSGIKKQEIDLRYVEIPDSKLENRSENIKKRARNYLPHLKRIPCKECKREFTKERALLNHMIRKHKKKYPCDKCDKVFIKAEFVKTHMAKVHEPKRGIFECAFCGTIYKNRHKMVQHLNKHEKYGPSLKDLENIVCDHCGKLCDRSNIKKHLIKHSEVKNYPCDFCDARFKTSEVREEHTRRKHMDPDVGRRFPCPQCPKKFFTTTQVKYHMTAMHFVQGKPCPVCSKCFATKSKVREHILRVHDKVPAVRDKQCDFCDKAFSTRRQLKHHRYTHTGEKPYKCDLCTSAYNQKHCLSVHKLRAHNVETPKSLIKNTSNATVTNLRVAGEFGGNAHNWYPLNVN